MSKWKSIKLFKKKVKDGGGRHPGKSAQPHPLSQATHHHMKWKLQFVSPPSQNQLWYFHCVKGVFLATLVAPHFSPSVTRWAGCGGSEFQPMVASRLASFLQFRNKTEWVRKVCEQERKFKANKTHPKFMKGPCSCSFYLSQTFFSLKFCLFLDHTKNSIHHLRKEIHAKESWRLKFWFKTILVCCFPRRRRVRAPLGAVLVTIPLSRLNQQTINSILFMINKDVWGCWYATKQENSCIMSFVEFCGLREMHCFLFISFFPFYFSFCLLCAFIWFIIFGICVFDCFCILFLSATFLVLFL